MNLQSRLDQFRSDNPYDSDTQAKRLLSAGNKDNLPKLTELGLDVELLIYVLSLGFTTAKHRERHFERDYMKNTGYAPQKEKLKPGRTTGSVVRIKLKPSKRMENIRMQMLLDTWRINGEQKLGDATENDLAGAIKRENASMVGHGKNAEFYSGLKERVAGEEKVRDKWEEKDVRGKIEQVYGEFRKSEAA